MKRRKKTHSAKQRELQATAHYEAGHVVAALHYELKFTYVTINPNEPPGSLGHVHVRRLVSYFFKLFEWGEATDRARMDVEHQIITMFTAGEAEARFSGRRNYVGARKDYAVAATLVGLRFSSHDPIWLGKTALSTYLAFTRTVAKGFVANERNWKMICAVAKALLAHPRHRLSQREAKEMLYDRSPHASELQ